MELEIDADQINKVYEVLESLGVDVVNEFDPVPPEELIEPENDRPERARRHQRGRPCPHVPEGDRQGAPADRRGGD